MSKFEIRDDRNLDVLFIHSVLDDYGLESYEFRLYCHIVRRAGKPSKSQQKGCWEAIGNMADKCRIDIKTARKALAFLEDRRLITVTKRPGYTSMMTLNGIEDWKPCDRPEKTKSQGTTKSGTTKNGRGVLPKTDYPPLPKTDYPPLPKTDYEVNPYEVNPNEVNPNKLNTPLPPQGEFVEIEINLEEWEPEPENLEIQDQENSDRIPTPPLLAERENKPLPLAEISCFDQFSSAAAAKKSKATSPTKAQIAQCFEAFRSQYNLIMGDIWAECAKPNELRLKAFTHLWKEHGESLFESLDYASRHLHETTWSREKAWSIDTMMRPGKMTGYAEMGKKVIDPEAARIQRLNKLYETFSEAIS